MMAWPGLLQIVTALNYVEERIAKNGIAAIHPVGVGASGKDPVGAIALLGEAHLGDDLQCSSHPVIYLAT